MCFSMIMQGYIQEECHFSKSGKILDLGWNVLPYSPDHAQSHFHLFCSLQNVPNDKNFSQEDQIKTFVENFLNSKPAEYYLSENSKQPDRGDSQ